MNTMPSDARRQQTLKALPPLRTPTWLRGGHLQTIWAKALREAQPSYRRELHHDRTGQTQVAYDWVDSSKPSAPVVVLFHGLEGSSHSHYARALMSQIEKRNWQGCVAHFRGCGGVPNTAPVAYHCGDSAEIAHMLKVVHQAHPQRPLFAVGVSLGGNALAKYAAEQGNSALCQAAAVISAPVDLPVASTALDQGLSYYLYNPYFLKTLLPKVKAEAPAYSGIDLNSVMHSRSLGDFDNRFTAPVHGFHDRYDYYRQSAAKPLLPEITIPTLLLNARNDPFMPASALPDYADVSAQVYLLQPAEGGHAGFIDSQQGVNLQWLPNTVLRFFELSQD